MYLFITISTQIQPKISFLKYVGISACPLGSDCCFLPERKSIVTTRRHDAIIFSVAQYFRYNKYMNKKQNTKLPQILLLISGNVKLNPRPINIKYLRSECARAVKFVASVGCDQCRYEPYDI